MIIIILLSALFYFNFAIKAQNLAMLFRRHKKREEALRLHEMKVAM